MRFPHRLSLAFFCFAILGCVSVAPLGRLSDACTGVPGDGRTPSQIDTPAVPTHGPGGLGQPIEIEAIARPATSSTIPLLYVFDSAAKPVFVDSSEVLKNSIFAKVEDEAYWGELVGDSFYRIPWLDKCSQASMVAQPLSFAAPPEGLLFMQFIAENCEQCKQITAAINDVVANHRQLKVRWVRVRVSSRIGKLSFSK